jgi:transcriptional regulator with XRE-family HTH domain
MSGKKKVTITLDGTFNLNDYANSHSTIGCNGKWEVKEFENIPYPLESMGIISLPIALVIQCPKCGSTYFIPGFEEFIRKIVATRIVISRRPLKDSEIRFLRIIFGLTQKEITEAIALESISYYSKCENGKEHLSIDKQVRLKLHYAYLLGIAGSKNYYTINRTTNDAPEETLISAELLKQCVTSEFLSKRRSNSKFH